MSKFFLQLVLMGWCITIGDKSLAEPSIMYDAIQQSIYDNSNNLTMTDKPNEHVKGIVMPPPPPPPPAPPPPATLTPAEKLPNGEIAKPAGTLARVQQEFDFFQSQFHADGIVDDIMKILILQLQGNKSAIREAKFDKNGLEKRFQDAMKKLTEAHPQHNQLAECAGHITSIFTEAGEWLNQLPFPIVTMQAHAYEMHFNKILNIWSRYLQLTYRRSRELSQLAREHNSFIAAAKELEAVLLKCMTLGESLNGLAKLYEGQKTHNFSSTALQAVHKILRLRMDIETRLAQIRTAETPQSNTNADYKITFPTGAYTTEENCLNTLKDLIDRTRAGHKNILPFVIEFAELLRNSKLGSKLKDISPNPLIDVMRFAQMSNAMNIIKEAEGVFLHIADSRFENIDHKQFGNMFNEEDNKYGACVLAEANTLTKDFLTSTRRIPTQIKALNNLSEKEIFEDLLPLLNLIPAGIERRSLYDAISTKFKVGLKGYQVKTITNNEDSKKQYLVDFVGVGGVKLGSSSDTFGNKIALNIMDKRCDGILGDIEDIIKTLHEFDQVWSRMRRVAEFVSISNDNDFCFYIENALMPLLKRAPINWNESEGRIIIEGIPTSKSGGLDESSFLSIAITLVEHCDVFLKERELPMNESFPSYNYRWILLLSERLYTILTKIEAALEQIKNKYGDDFSAIQRERFAEINRQIIELKSNVHAAITRAKS